MNRKVTYVRFQTELFVPGIPAMGNVLPSQTKKLDGLAMTATPLGLTISVVVNGKEQTFLTPYANIVLMTLAPEEKPSKKSNE